MIVNQQTIRELYVNLNVRWNIGKNLYVPEYTQIASKENSTKLTEAYLWLSRSPRMRKMIGEKLIRSLRPYRYELTNETYEASIAIPKDSIEDDELLGFGGQAEDFGLSAAQLYDDMVCNMAFNDMFSMESFDDQAFCDTDHPLYRSDGSAVTYSNKMTKKLSAASSAAADASIGAAIAMMRGFKDEEGAPLGGAVKFRLVVSPVYEQIADKLAKSDYLVNGDANTYKGKFDVYVNRWISDANADYWALLNVGGRISPFILQERKAPQFVYVDASGASTAASAGQVSEGMFMRREYLFGNEARGAYGCSFPWLIVGSTGAVA